MSDKPTIQPSRLEMLLTIVIGVFVLISAGAGVFVPGFYDGIVDPRYATGTITADIVSLICVPLLGICITFAHRANPVARLSWASLGIYLGYAYATYAFDRLYTPLFPLYMAIFGMSFLVVVSIFSRLDVPRLAEFARDLPLRRFTAVFLMFTGLILYVIEFPIILSRIPDGIHAGGTPFMVMDMSLVAPISILTGIWLWQNRPWGVVLTAVFLIKAITLMSSFLIADYIDWFAGRPMEPAATIAFTMVYLFVLFCTWNYFSVFNRQEKLNLMAES